MKVDCANGESGSEGSADVSVAPHLQMQAPSPLDYSNKVVSLAVEHINRHFITEME